MSVNGSFRSRGRLVFQRETRRLELRSALDRKCQNRVCEGLPTQHDAVERRQTRDLLDEALGRLDEDKQAVFVLYELEEMAMPEIAEALACPLQTAYSRLHAARKEVKAFFMRHAARRETFA